MKALQAKREAGLVGRATAGRACNFCPIIRLAPAFFMSMAICFC
jgi:hypothetical protein